MTNILVRLLNSILCCVMSDEVPVINIDLIFTFDDSLFAMDVPKTSLKKLICLSFFCCLKSNQVHM